MAAVVVAATAVVAAALEAAAVAATSTAVAVVVALRRRRQRRWWTESTNDPVGGSVEPTINVIRGAARNLPRVSARKMRESTIAVTVKVPGARKSASATNHMFAMATTYTWDEREIECEDGLD